MTWLARFRAALHAHSRARHLVEGLAVAVLVGTAVTAAWGTGLFESFERNTLDQRFRWHKGQLPPHPDIVVVELTDGDLEEHERVYKTAWPWPREAYALATQWLKDAGAKAVFFDFSFQDSAKNYEEADKKFAAAVKEAGNVYILVTFNATRQRFPERIPDLEAKSAGNAPSWMHPYEVIVGPMPGLIEGAKGLVSPTYGEREKDPDGVGRRYPVGHAHHGHAFLSPGVALAAEYLGEPAELREDGLYFGKFHVPVDGDGEIQVHWINGRKAFSGKGYTLGGILNNQIGRLRKKPVEVPYDPADFKGKIVLIGAAAEGLYDFKASPVEKSMLGVEFHATALDSILRDRVVRRTGAAAVVPAVFFFALLAGVAGIALRIRWLLPLVLLAAAAHVALADRALFRNNVWVDIVAPMAALGLATTGSALVNYAVEGRQKRDIRAKFGTYLTPEYVKMLEENPGLFKLGGEERTGTAFFSDLSGFTAMSEKMTAAELVARMNEYLTLMTTSIKRFRGTVDKYEGDAIVAFWNAPIVQPDHAVLACRAALDNQRELKGLRERWIKAYGVTVVARIGINTGNMIFGNMGSDDKFNYTMMGDPVNLASRLEGANKDYGTFMMIGPETYELVKDHMELRELDLIKVKGKQIPVTVYELICEKGQLDPRTRECLDRYNLGLQAYRMKQFHAAEQRFLEALEIRPDDAPSKLYVARSKALVEKPPEPGWTYIYEKKDK